MEIVGSVIKQRPKASCQALADALNGTLHLQ